LTETILVVDDDEALRTVIVEVLRNKDYCVLEASDGERGLEALMDNPGRIDLVIVDWELPKLRGLEVGKLAQLCDNGLKVLLISGHEPDPRGLAFLAKPFAIDKLLATVARLLAEPAKVNA